MVCREGTRGSRAGNKWIKEGWQNSKELDSICGVEILPGERG